MLKLYFHSIYRVASLYLSVVFLDSFWYFPFPLSAWFSLRSYLRCCPPAGRHRQKIINTLLVAFLEHSIKYLTFLDNAAPFSDQIDFDRPTFLGCLLWLTILVQRHFWLIWNKLCFHPSFIVNIRAIDTILC